MADTPARGEMPFLEHLEELRWRLFRSAIAVLIGAIIGWVVVTHWDVLGLLMIPIAPLVPGGHLMVTGPAEAFFITLKLAVAVGVVLASPVVVYQTWAFLTPALYDRERRVVVPSLVAGVVLFAIGAGAAYFLVLPRALGMLLSFQRAHLAPIITAEKYFGFAIPLILAFGAITEMPLVLVILAGFGIVNARFLARNRRYALLVAGVVAAFLAPPDALSMIVMMVPMVALYEISIWCVWVVGKRRERRERRAAAEGGGGGGGGGGPGRAALIVVLLLALGAGGLRAQRPLVNPKARRDSLQDTTRAGGPPGAPVQGKLIDTATARRLGLPTAPTRSFPPADALMDSLLARKGYRITHYTADSLVMHQGPRGNELELRRDALVDQDGSKLQADSIHYVQASCRLDASGAPSLFGDNNVMVGDSLKYDNCLKRGVISNALTSFRQGSGTWFMRGDIAVDSGSTRMFGASSSITSSDLPLPDYHFQAGQVKWLNKNVMIARPAVLYIRDVPLMWLPFIFQDIRPGRRSGVLVPQFGLNDLVRPTRQYQRHIANLGYYWVPNEYLDLLGRMSWYSNRYVQLSGLMQYRWLDRFIQGNLTYSRMANIDQSGTSTQLSWYHNQSFDSRTKLAAQVNYATSAQVIQQNTVDPFLSTAQLSSQANFQKQFSWGTVNLGGSRSQNLSSELVNQTFPTFSFTPSPINITQSLTWSPGISYTNQQTFHNPGTALLAALPTGIDTLSQFYDARQTAFALQTPIRIGGWNWSNSLSISDQASNQRREYFIQDSLDPNTLRKVLYVRTFQTTADWQTSFGLPSLFTNTWKLQPQISVLNSTLQGPYAIRNQFTGGQWVHQGKRLGFGASLAPTFFGFFPGFGPVDRIRHSLQFIVNYLYAPGASVDSAYSRAIDPSGLNRAAQSDPQQTISIGLSQNIEAKLKPPAGDTTGQGRKIRLLSINTSQVQYNFERAKEPGYTGWQTQTLTNTFASDLVPGFTLSLTHDLWAGVVGIKGVKFSPYLTNVSASFSITGATIRGIGSLLGLASSRPATPAAGAGGAANAGLSPSGGTTVTLPGAGIPPAYPGGIRGMAGAPYAGGMTGGGFSLQVSFTSTRQRVLKDSSSFIQVQTDSQYQAPVPIPGTSGVDQEQMNLTMHFSPTPHWDLGWTTTYDFHTHQFGQHYIQLQRDLRRWQASFAFVKSPNGTFAFNFRISLKDEQDIKFDYDQQTFRQPQ